MFTFNVGTIVDIRYVSRANPRVVTPNDLCRSHHIREIGGPEGTDLIQCITPDRSKVQDENLLIRYQGAGLDCEYQTFDPDDPTKITNKIDFSMCGFNQNTAGY